MLTTALNWLLAASPLAVLAGFALAFLAVLLALQQIKPGPVRTLAERLDEKLATVRHQLGVEGLPPWLFLLAAGVWLVILLMLLAGVIMVLRAALFDPLPAGNDETWNFRFLLAQLAAVTTVLGVVVAFPVTLNRLRLTSEDNATKAAALYNDKINAALTDLHAQRQITAWKRREGHIDIWEDDIVRRNGAIDRLESLANQNKDENKDEAPRIARMLATYLRELSELYPAKDPPADATPGALRDWAGKLTRARSDMENAAQTLGRLIDATGMTPEIHRIDLHGANLQAMTLTGARLEGANLFEARLEGANLFEARLEGANLIEARLEGADLGGAHLEGADLGGAHLEGARLNGAHLEGATLISARLEGANLFEARLEGANLSGARFDQSTDFSAADTPRR